jgi:hypothetical protein
MNNTLTVVAYIFLAIGMAIVFGAKFIVNKYKLHEKAVCKFANELSEKELEEYKFNQSVVGIKMKGLLAAMPGIIIILTVHS